MRMLWRSITIWIIMMAIAVTTIVPRCSMMATRAWTSSPTLLRTPPRWSSSISSSSTLLSESVMPAPTKMINLHTVPLDELESILVSWGHKKFRAKQVYDWIHTRGVLDVDQMNNIPNSLKRQLQDHAADGSLQLDTELVSKDGTIKRAYRLHDGHVIESVLMPYNDGRYTACISSQAGCAQGCVFCATGQMGMKRQLTADEIFEQVSRFAAELVQQDKEEERQLKSQNCMERKVNQSNKKRHNKSKRLSNIVFMGMGEPLANYRNVVNAIHRIQSELGIGYRRITVSTVGIVPNIQKLAVDLPQVKLAVSLHCATDEERTALLPANERYGGLDTLMETLRDYVTGINTTGDSHVKSRPRRLTLEWALIEGENDTPETAHALGKLINRWLHSRRDMIHINVIPLNPTGGYGQGRPSSRHAVDNFCKILEDRYGVTCTPRVRRGIDINAGCGQLTAQVMQEDEKKQKEQQQQQQQQQRQENGPRELSTDDDKRDDEALIAASSWEVDDEEEDWEYEFSSPQELDEAARLISLVQGTTISSSTSSQPKQK